MLFARGGSASPGELCGQLTQSAREPHPDWRPARGARPIRRSTHPVDRRRQVISITPAGEQIVQLLIPRVTSAMTQLFDDFGPEERDRFLQYLLRLMQALDAVPEEAERGHHRMSRLPASLSRRSTCSAAGVAGRLRDGSTAVARTGSLARRPPHFPAPSQSQPDSCVPRYRVVAQLRRRDAG